MNDYSGTDILNRALKERYEFAIPDLLLEDSEIHLGNLLWQEQTLWVY